MPLSDVNSGCASTSSWRGTGTQGHFCLHRHVQKRPQQSNQSSWKKKREKRGRPFLR